MGEIEVGMVGGIGCEGGRLGCEGWGRLRWKG